MNSESLPEGLRFEHMGGHGRLTCGDCGYSQEVTSFTHAVHCSSSGFQCQSCGKFSTRSRTDPFPYSYENEGLALSMLPSDERGGRIEHLLGMIALCEIQMKETSASEWLSTWESTVNECKAELSTVSDEELLRMRKIREEFEKAYELSLICDCQGSLKEDQTIFCPVCKSRKLVYNMEYIS